MSKRKWWLVGRPEPKGSGQRFFMRAAPGVWDIKVESNREDRARAIREGGVKLYVADNSGTYPDTTDDGPLVLLRDCPVVIGFGFGRLGGEATVQCEDGERNSRCGFTLREALWLVEKAGFDLALTVEAREAIAIQAKLWTAWQAQDHGQDCKTGARVAP